MFWTRKPPPTKVELARDAALSAAHSLSERASDLSNTLSHRAHDVLEAVPTESIVQRWDDLRHSTAERMAEAAERVIEAEKALAERWAHTRPVVEEKAHEAAQSAAEAAHSTQQQLAKRKKDLDAHLHQQAKELEKQKAALGAKHDALKQALADKASEAQAKSHKAQAEAQALAEAAAAKAAKQHAKDVKAAKKFVDAKQADAKATIEVVKGGKTVVPVFVAEDEDIRAYTDDSDTEIQVRESGGTSILVWLGVGLILGALAIYFFAPGSGRRSRAAIKDRLGKVKDDLVDETTKKSDGNSARIEAINEKAGNKLAEVASVVADKVEDAAQALSSKVEGAGESLAHGLENAGAGASDAAQTAAVKVEDAKQTLAERLEAAGETHEPAMDDPTEFSTAPASEIVVTDTPAHASVNDVVKEAEATVEQIETAARKKKPKSTNS